MFTSSAPIDFTEELMYRCWARRNYLPPELRDGAWHPLILEEMANRDRELAEEALWEEALNHPRHNEFVPLVPTLTHIIHPAHLDIREPHIVSMRHPAASFSVESIYAGGVYEFPF